jgi:hypothetical protein
MFAFAFFHLVFYNLYLNIANVSVPGELSIIQTGIIDIPAFLFYSML